MLTEDDLTSLRGATIAAAEIRNYEGGQVLRLHLAGGGILAVSVEADGLRLADETSIP